MFRYQDVREYMRRRGKEYLFCQTHTDSFTDFNAQKRKNRNGYETIMGPHIEGNRKREGKNITDMYNRNDHMIGNNWFQKRRSHKITHYSWDGSVGSITDYLILIRNLWNILTDVTVILNTGL
jgi:hypothetical protein